jgi:hypothetical protein
VSNRFIFGRSSFRYLILKLTIMAFSYIIDILVARVVRISTGAIANIWGAP